MSAETLAPGPWISRLVVGLVDGFHRASSSSTEGVTRAFFAARRRASHGLDQRAAAGKLRWNRKRQIILMSQPPALERAFATLVACQETRTIARRKRSRRRERPAARTISAVPAEKARTLPARSTRIASQQTRTRAASAGTACAL